MKRFILGLGMLIPILGFSQYGNDVQYTKFTKSEKKFNSWSISAFGGTSVLQSADLISVRGLNQWNSYEDDVKIGHDFQLGLNKQITHSFGLQLVGGMGRTLQGNEDLKVSARTEYKLLSLLGDLNLSSLFRRVDNKSTYRWALHTYAGVGVLDYDTKLNAEGHLINGTQDNGYHYQTGSAWVKSPTTSLFAQAGAGLRFKINSKWDAEAKAMYVYTGDEAFDGGGSQYSELNMLSKKASDNMITASIGLHYKLGKFKESLQWFDPLQELYPAQKNELQPEQNPGCAEDKDQDGVCDNLDKQLDTPLGARVDGSGVAMDTDYDGLIDPLDKCPTMPGTIENKGCPVEKQTSAPSTSVPSNNFPAIEFMLNSDKLTAESSPILDNASSVLKQFFPNDKVIIEGHTDAHGSEAYNLDLSKRRVDTVIRYLGGKGVNTNNLTPIAKGSSELKLQKCNPASKCTDLENKQNRRVIFKLKN